MDALRDLVRHVLNVSIEEIAEDELAAFFYALADQDQNGEGRSGGGAWSFYKILGLLESDYQRQQEQPRKSRERHGGSGGRSRSRTPTKGRSRKKAVAAEPFQGPPWRPPSTKDIGWRTPGRIMP